PLPRHTLFPYTTLFRSQRGASGFFLALAGCRSNHPQCAGKRLDVLGHSRFGGSLTYPFPRNKAATFRRGNQRLVRRSNGQGWVLDRKSTRLNSSHVSIS